jgi:hypothetical protein
VKGLALGFWAMVVAVVVEAASAGPGLIARQPGAAVRLSIAGLVFACYVANTLLTVRRLRAADPASAANFVWAHGGLGLALAAALLWLV